MTHKSAFYVDFFLFTSEFINLLKSLIKTWCDFSSLLINNTFNTCSLNFFETYRGKTLFSYPKTRTLILNQLFHNHVLS